MMPGILLLAIAVHAVSFIRLGRSLRNGSLAYGRAVARFMLLGIAPTLAFAGFILLFVGIEEITSSAIISEGVGRSSPIVAGILLLFWILSTVSFAVYCAWVVRTRR